MCVVCVVWCVCTCNIAYWSILYSILIMTEVEQWVALSIVCASPDHMSLLSGCTSSYLLLLPLPCTLLHLPLYLPPLPLYPLHFTLFPIPFYLLSSPCALLPLPLFPPSLRYRCPILNISYHTIAQREIYCGVLYKHSANISRSDSPGV